MSNAYEDVILKTVEDSSILKEHEYETWKGLPYDMRVSVYFQMLPLTKLEVCTDPEVLNIKNSADLFKIARPRIPFIKKWSGDSNHPWFYFTQEIANRSTQARAKNNTSLADIRGPPTFRFRLTSCCCLIKDVKSYKYRTFNLEGKSFVIENKMVFPGEFRRKAFLELTMLTGQTLEIFSNEVLTAVVREFYSEKTGKSENLICRDLTTFYLIVDKVRGLTEHRTVRFSDPSVRSAKIESFLEEMRFRKLLLTDEEDIRANTNVELIDPTFLPTESNNSLEKINPTYHKINPETGAYHEVSFLKPNPFDINPSDYLVDVSQEYPNEFQTPESGFLFVDEPLSTTTQTATNAYVGKEKSKEPVEEEMIGPKPAKQRKISEFWQKK